MTALLCAISFAAGLWCWRAAAALAEWASAFSYDPYD